MDGTYPGTYNSCNGGTIIDAYTYLYEVGAHRDCDYPYTSQFTGESGSLKFIDRKAYAELADTGTLVPSDETAIQQALVSYGPLSHDFYVCDVFENYT